MIRQKLTNDVAELLHRTEKSRNSAPPPVQQEPKERRHIYGGNDPQAETPGYAVRPANKKVVQQKRRSTFNIVAALFLSAIAMIVYIHNILEVNQLAVEVHRLQALHEKTVNANNVLRSEINKKSSWERIGDAAEREGLMYPKERPTAFEVDEELLNKFKDEE